MRIARNGNGTVDQRPDERPDKAGDGLCPAAHDLQAKGQTVDIWAVVRNNAKRQHNKTELAEAAEGWEKHRCEQPADAGILITFPVDVGALRDGGGCDG